MSRAGLPMQNQWKSTTVNNNYEHAVTYFFNLNTSSWLRGPYLAERKQYHTCSLVTQPDGTRDVVVVGGYRYYQGSKCYHQRSVDIINLDTNTKQAGKRIMVHHNLNYHSFLFCSRTKSTCWSLWTHSRKLWSEGYHHGRRRWVLMHQ